MQKKKKWMVLQTFLVGKIYIIYFFGFWEGRLGQVLWDFVWFTNIKIEFLPDEMNFWSDKDSKHLNSN